MFKASMAFVLLVLWYATASTQNVSSTLASKDLLLTHETELGLEVEARSPGASWAKSGAEAAAITIEVDGAYNQDLLLWAGDRPFYI
jgi:hypothetical protein